MEVEPPIKLQGVTADEFMSLPVERAELVDGDVVEKMPRNFDHGESEAIIAAALLAFVRKNGLGRVSVDGSFRTLEGRVRAPDVAFISNEDLRGKSELA